VTLDSLFQQSAHLQSLGNNEAAAFLYAGWLRSNVHPHSYLVWFNYGALLQKIGRYDEACAAYAACLQFIPNFPPALINLGLSYESKQDFEKALAAWAQLTDGPMLQDTEWRGYFLAALNHAARLLEDLDRLDQANEVLERSLSIDPRQTDVLHHWVHVQQKACQWPVYRALDRVRINSMILATSPLPMLAMTDDPAVLLLNAREFVRRKWGFDEKRLASKPRKRARIRLAYLSGDFCTHAVGVLLPEVLYAHDRNAFELYAYDYSREDGSSIRNQILACFDQVRAVHTQTDEEVAKIIASDQIDILIDLQGISLGARPGIAACRPAALQGTWLGFIGTTGMPWLDFVVTDPYALPPSLEPFFTEEPLHVDGSFLPLALLRQNAVSPMTRSEAGFEREQIVIAALANVYKITPEMFLLWMRLLKRFPASVLWLLDDNPTASENLKRMASALGVEVSRIRFTKREAYPVYLRRLEHADLFLDSFPYNCGSTTRDVVSCGVPLVSLSGRSMVSRMGGSVLTALGLNDYIASSFSDYEGIAAKLIDSPAERAHARARVHHALCASSAQISRLVRSLEQQLKSRLSILDME